MIARYRSLSIFLVLAPLLITHPPVSAAQPGETATVKPSPEPSRVTWKALELEASKFFITAETSVRFEHVRSAQADEVRVRVDTEVLGKKTSDEIRLAAATARTIRRHKRQYEKDPYAKTYRFGTDRILETRRAPADETEAKQPPEKWTQRRKTEHRPGDGVTCRFFADPTALLYVASAHEWTVGGPPVELCIFSDETFSRMTIRAVETAAVEVDYRVGRGDETESRSGEIETTVLQIDVAPHDPDTGESAYEVLGLKDDVRLHLDPKHRLPVLITGKMDVVGNVKIKLRRAELR